MAEIKTKSEILELFDEAVLECESQFRSLLSTTGDYENIVRDAWKEKKINPDELNWILDSLKRKAITFSECIKRVEKDFWEKHKKVLDENVKKFGSE